MDVSSKCEIEGNMVIGHKRGLLTFSVITQLNLLIKHGFKARNMNVYSSIPDVAELPYAVYE